MPSIKLCNYVYVKTSTWNWGDVKKHYIWFSPLHISWIVLGVFLRWQEPGSHDGIESSAAPAKEDHVEYLRMKVGGTWWNPVLGNGHHFKQAPSKTFVPSSVVSRSMVKHGGWACSFGRSVGVRCSGMLRTVKPVNHRHSSKTNTKKTNNIVSCFWANFSTRFPRCKTTK